MHQLSRAHPVGYSVCMCLQDLSAASLDSDEGWLKRTVQPQKLAPGRTCPLVEDLEAILGVPHGNLLSKGKLAADFCTGHCSRLREVLKGGHSHGVLGGIAKDSPGFRHGVSEWQKRQPLRCDDGSFPQSLFGWHRQVERPFSEIRGDLACKGKAVTRMGSPCCRGSLLFTNHEWSWERTMGMRQNQGPSAQRKKTTHGTGYVQSVASHPALAVV